MPQLSRGLRERVIVDVRRQVRYGRWADRLKIAGAVLVASLLVVFVWNNRWTGQEQVAEKPPEVAPTQMVTPTVPSSSSLSSSESLSQDPVRPVLPQGGPRANPEVREMQQINRLIEDIQGRNNVLCGLLPIW